MTALLLVGYAVLLGLTIWVSIVTADWWFYRGGQARVSAFALRMVAKFFGFDQESDVVLVWRKPR